MNWDDYYLNMAKAASLKSKDTTKVGAVIVGSDNRIVSVGFNGPPSRIPDDPSIMSNRGEHPGLTKYLISVHGEMNALLHARSSEVAGGTLYCTHQPCPDCAKHIIAAGINRVVFDREAKTVMDAGESVVRQLFDMAGISSSFD